MVAPEVPAYVFGALSAIGGTMGFIKGKSVPSLVAGVGIGAVYAIAGSRIAAKQAYGAEIAISVSLLLIALMGKKAVTTAKPVPVLMSSIGVIGTLYYLNILLNGVGKAKKL
ncbi:transmembrane proteins 14C-domain-containing protein [Chytriomyces sp. MP71]|nr:transmembrane proteins 14C-domain-containing protein [Chytriomyces sp. MP71]